jgi:hypothetical protein
MLDGVGGKPGALLIHAKDERAKIFFERLNRQPLPGSPPHLVLLLKDGRRLITQ